MKSTLFLCTILCLLSSCRSMSQGPYKNYRVTDDEALPACQMRNAIYQHKR